MIEILVPYVLAFGRAWGFFSVMPQIGEQDMPNGVKFALIAGITPFLIAGSDHPPAISSEPYLVLLLAKEVLLGLFIGFIVSLPLRLPQLIGDMIDNQRGAAINSQFNPALGEENAILGQLLAMCLLAYFYTEGGFLRLISILASSFELQSPFSFEFGFGENFFIVAMTAVNHYLQLFGILALPIMLVMLMADISLGVASRFATSLNVFSMSQPVKAVVALAMLASMHPRMMAAYLAFFNRVEEIFL